MTGHVSEDRLALYAGGDLPASHAGAVAAHIEQCADCRSALAGFAEARELLIASAEDPDPRDLYEIRQRVISRLCVGGRGKRWRWALAGVAAAVALFIFGAGHHPKTANTLAPVAQLSLPPVPAPLMRVAPVVHHTRPQLRPGLRSVALISQAEHPALMRMTTADPNVVILWESDTKGEKE